MPTYLTLEEAKDYFAFEPPTTKIIDGVPVEIPLPSDEILTKMIDRLEIYLDFWIKQRLAPTLYRQVKKTNYVGNVVPSYYPLLAVVSAKSIRTSLVKQDIASQEAKALNPKEVGIQEYRRVNMVVYRDSPSVIETPYPYGFVEIIYWAGYDPIPPIVKECLFNALLNVVKRGMSHLNQVISQKTSVSLPEGLSQSTRYPNFLPDERTYLDSYFLPLESYRRTLKWY